MKSSSPVGIAIVILFLLFSSKYQTTSAQIEVNPFKWLPGIINAWQPATDDRIYSEEDLFDYIDGGAELFLSYGFKNVFNRIYSHMGQPDIFVDIFEMNSSYDAYGVFSQSREKNENDFGRESQYSLGAIMFWKDKYYISLITSPETEESKRTIFELAKIIDNAIPEKGDFPRVLDFLPRESLIKESIRYFRHPNWINSHFFISYENIFSINQNTHALLAKYNFSHNRPILLLIEYPDAKDVIAGYDSFIKNYLPELSGKFLIQTQDGLWIGTKLFDNLLAVVFKASDQESLIKIIDSIKTNSH
ncbi:MAG: hypothetical protein A2V66_17700 [Ignavibacteria bacterium RBG_13_36_8]|nr:MAG: hypothetical protein A2V66_17700 [Ignavibacteria bacterium RBG_13_36_8]